MSHPNDLWPLWRNQVFQLASDINSPIHDFFYQNIYLFIDFFGLKSFSLIQILRGHQNAFHSIRKIIITPNFVKKIFVDWWKLIGELMSRIRYLSIFCKAMLVLSSKSYFRDLAFPIFLSLYYLLAAYCPFQHIKFNEFTSYKNTNFCRKIINIRPKKFIISQAILGPILRWFFWKTFLSQGTFFSVYFLLFPYPKDFSHFFSSHWKK